MDEKDEEPPHDLDHDAKKISLLISSMLKSKIFSEIHVMRKTVIDGSNTSGFQRTMLVSQGGNLKVNEKNIGVKLTESFAMWPASSVSGYYFANNHAKYFGLGKISSDQVIDYAKRRNITIEKAKKWLNPNINDV